MTEKAKPKNPAVESASREPPAGLPRVFCVVFGPELVELHRWHTIDSLPPTGIAEVKELDDAGIRSAIMGGARVETFGDLKSAETRASFLNGARLRRVAQISRKDKKTEDQRAKYFKLNPSLKPLLERKRAVGLAEARASVAEAHEKRAKAIMEDQAKSERDGEVARQANEIFGIGIDEK